MLFIVMMIYGIGFAILFPSINALLVENTTDDNRGKAFGLFYAFFSLELLLAPLQSAQSEHHLASASLSGQHFY